MCLMGPTYNESVQGPEFCVLPLCGGVSTPTSTVSLLPLNGLTKPAFEFTCSEIWLSNRIVCVG